MSFAIDDRVYVKHPKKSWIPGFITGRDTKTGLYTVTDDDHDEISKIPQEHITICREDLLNEGIEPVVHDLLFLTELHDATLLRCLKVRYMKDIIYTNIGAIVVALNPFNFKIPWYLDTCIDKYLQEGDVVRHNLPHSWAVAHNTYFEMRNEKRAQTILVSGESGAGKTEACKMVMKYLGRVSMTSATEEQIKDAEGVRIKILQSSPILEGFGNAKTVRNNNSSRFGKFMKVKFHDSGYLTGAFTINYLLEKSRIITAASNERVYHSFYYLSKGKDAATYGVKGPAEYRSTNAGRCIAVEGCDDANDYIEVLEAMDILGVQKDQQEQLWKVVGGVLSAQNIDLTPLDMDNTIVADHAKPFVQKSAELWGVSADKMIKEILTTTSTVRGETYVMNLKLAQATDMRDALCKHMYEKLFHWLIQKTNEATDQPGEFQQWIGVLDIFGFEDFENGNSFEQLCINLTNETLQNHYNNYIFKRDMEECRAEGICVDDVKCPDNADCLKLIADNAGILGLLDEECRLGTGTDEGFLEKVIQNCKSNPFFDRKPTSRGNFIVKHYAGNVTYTVKGFLDKNRDTLKDDMKLLMRTSTSALAAELLPEPVDRVGKAPTVGGFFKMQVAELLFVINSTNPHWIRCVKPHPAKKPLHFDGVQVTNQLESSGVLGTVKIRKAGYPVRMTFANFFARYKILIGRASVEAPMEDQHNAVRKAMKASKTTPREVQLGKTRVFMKSEAYFILEKTREEAGMTHRLNLQSASRSIIAQLQKRKKIWLQNIVIIQEEFRDYLKRSEEVRIARRKAKEALLAAQKQAREDFVREAISCFQDISLEYEVESNALMQQMRSHAMWIQDKLILDAEERVAFYQLELRKRQELFGEFKNGLEQWKGEKFAMHIEACPMEEEWHRVHIAREEDKYFQNIEKAFQEHGSAMFRLEIERAERRYRRTLLRMEDLQYLEFMQRMIVLPEFINSLNRAVHPFGPIIRAIKEYADTVARRAARRREIKLENDEIEHFSTRHPRDQTKLARELAAIQVGNVYKHDHSYMRTGDKKVMVTKFSTNEAWQGVTGVPDIDQVLAGMHFDRKAKPHERASSAESESKSIPSVSFSKTAELKATGVFEAFRDQHEEMSFLRSRHLLAQEFRTLSRCGRYDGTFMHETEIPDKRTFFAAQDKLQLLSIEFSEELVRELRKLNSFCETRHIPEQNRITGEWLQFQPVPKTLLATYPPCTDYKKLLQEKNRLEYATENYKRELLKIVRSAVSRGARLMQDVSQESSVEQVHAAYFHLKGHFQACKKCLFPMATKNTLVQLRLLWPHLQDSQFPDRCRDCNTGFFGSSRGGLAQMTLASKARSMKYAPQI